MLKLEGLKEGVEEVLTNSSNTIIVPHTNIDIDAIASAMGFSLISEKYKKPYSIVFGDDEANLENGVKRIYSESKNHFNFVGLDKLEHSKDSTFVLTDVSSKFQTWIPSELSNSKRAIIIDHHDSYQNKVPAKVSYINSEASSASEIMTFLLKNLRIKIPKEIAVYLLAGIKLDTMGLSSHITRNTTTAMGYLIDAGGSIEAADNYFREDFEEYQITQEILKEVDFRKTKIALITAPNQKIYRSEQLARAADKAAIFQDVDAAFVIGRIGNDTIKISARSFDAYDVGKILLELGGGGRPNGAGAVIEGEKIDEVKQRLLKAIKPSYFIREV